MSVRVGEPMSNGWPEGRGGTPSGRGRPGGGVNGGTGGDGRRDTGGDLNNGEFRGGDLLVFGEAGWLDGVWGESRGEGRVGPGEREGDRLGGGLLGVDVCRWGLDGDRLDTVCPKLIKPKISIANMR